MHKIKPCLMFPGRAEEALNFYTDVFDDAEILDLTRYGEGEAEREGLVKLATLAIGELQFIAIDSTAGHEFGFTPSISFQVACASNDEINRMFRQLSDGGAVMMPLQAYPFSPKFAWVADRFGVSWQLNLVE